MTDGIALTGTNEHPAQGSVLASPVARGALIGVGVLGVLVFSGVIAFLASKSSS